MVHRWSANNFFFFSHFLRVNSGQRVVGSKGVNTLWGCLLLSATTTLFIALSFFFFFLVNCCFVPFAAVVAVAAALFERLGIMSTGDVCVLTPSPKRWGVCLFASSLCKSRCLWNARQTLHLSYTLCLRRSLPACQGGLPL